LKLAKKFTLLEEPADDFDIAEDAVFAADWPDLVLYNRRIVPKESTQDLRLPIVRSISWSKLAKIRVRVGGWRWKSTWWGYWHVRTTYDMW
jgi:hypothetical protein